MKMREFNPYIPMVDFFLIVMMVMFALFATSLVQVNPPVPKKALQASSIAPEGLFVVVMTWPDDSNDDIDLLMMNPRQDVVYFNNDKIGLMTHDTDDRGSLGETATNMSGGQVKVTHNEERIIVHGIIPGEYVVNVLLFAKYDGPKDVPVTVTLYRLKGQDEPLIERTVVLRRTSEEHTMFRMTIDEQGQVTDVNELQRPMIRKAAGQ